MIKKGNKGTTVKCLSGFPLAHTVNGLNMFYLFMGFLLKSCCLTVFNFLREKEVFDWFDLGVGNAYRFSLEEVSRHERCLYRVGI